MKLLAKLALPLLAGLFLVACASRSPEANAFGRGLPEEQKPMNLLDSEIKLVYIQTPLFNFYDYARLNTYRSGLIKLELFKYGQTIGSIRIKGSRMCVLNECSFKWPISKKFFGSVSYGNLFQDILFGKDIFDGRGKIVAANNVVVQRFQQSGQVIYYERKPGHRLFKNLSTNVTIAIDDYSPLGIDNGVKNSLAIPENGH
ncbi:hypothetical protein [Helicobacter sp. 11S02629-2]|uniref:HP0838 family lipoprotein n=1 Tax=Helicobacter sp. 11S02629-2 TaxID=1476195 RepID=UPI000BA64487|nr:hypothetical protein [Helicobacter sp. 11S02629-2]PAF42419.1 hypothetical protein BKH40_07885 [Helicobacter sp. 11S02629-2]